MPSKQTMASLTSKVLKIVFYSTTLYFADGDEKLASDLANEMIHQRYQPATPSF